MDLEDDEAVHKRKVLSATFFATFLEHNNDAVDEGCEDDYEDDQGAEVAPFAFVDE
jgi:hypothetical protein